MVRRALVLLFLCGSSAAALAQATTAPPSPAQPPPRIRRWLDVQNLHLTSRFRWVESNRGRITSSAHQWQPNIRARFLIDPQGRYTIHGGALSGSHFVSGWNNSGGGLGAFAGDFAVRQLFMAAEPWPGIEFQGGGLYMTRGENTEITAYDNDAFIVGERVTVRRAQGTFSQLVATIGHIGDYRTPSVFRRLDALGDINYGQLLVGARLGRLTAVSADYTYEDGRDIFRQGVTVRLPQSALPLAGVKLESYQRVSEASGQGFNVSGDLRVFSRLSMTAGLAHIDRNFLIPGYMSPNGDRYERGTRFYTQGTYALTRDLSIGWFQGEAIGVDYDIPNEHRWEVVVTVNPTATLRARRVF